MTQRANGKVFIEGPVTFAEYYNPSTKKHVYVFGDIHVNNIHCPKELVDNRFGQRGNHLPFHNLVKKMLRAKSKTKIDVFVESKFLRDSVVQEETLGDVPLAEFRKTFSPCLRYSKDSCKKLYPGARFHYMDIRDLFPSDLITAIYNIENPSPYLFQLLRNNYRDVANIINDVNHRQEEMLEFLKIKKQWNAIPSEETRNSIKEYFDIRLSLFRTPEETVERIFNNLESNLDNLEQLTPDQLLGLLEGQHDNIAKTLGLYYDYYTICRLLRKFSDGTDINKCVVYEGERHATEHRNLLSLLGFELLNISSSQDASTRTENFQCIRLPNLNSFLGKRLSIKYALNPIYGEIVKDSGILTTSKLPVKQGKYRIIRLSEKGTYETLE